MKTLITLLFLLGLYFASVKGQYKPNDHLTPPASLFEHYSIGPASYSYIKELYDVLRGGDHTESVLGYQHLTRVFVLSSSGPEYAISMEHLNPFSAESEIYIYLIMVDDNFQSSRIYQRQKIAVKRLSKVVLERDASVIYDLFYHSIMNARHEREINVFGFGGTNYYLSVRQLGMENPIARFAAAEIRNANFGLRVTMLTGIIERLKEAILESEEDALVLDDDFLEEIKALTRAFNEEEAIGNR